MAPGPRPSRLLRLLVWGFAPSFYCTLSFFPVSSRVASIPFVPFLLPWPGADCSKTCFAYLGDYCEDQREWCMRCRCFETKMDCIHVGCDDDDDLWTIFRWLKMSTQPGPSQHILLSPGLSHTGPEVWQFKQLKNLLVEGNAGGGECLGNELPSLGSQWEIWYPGKH